MPTLSPEIDTKAVQQGAKQISNSERKRQAREKLLVEQRRFEKVNGGHVTAHRAEELYWKGPEPEWSRAFTAESESIAQTDSPSAIWRDRNVQEWALQRCTLDDGREAVLFLDRPGLVYLPNYLDLPQQRSLIAACLHETTGPASRTNLDTHYVPPSQGWWTAFTETPEEIVQPRHQASSALAGDSNVLVKDSKRLQVDLPPMNQESFGQEMQSAVEKKEPQPSDTVQPATLQELIRKMRWTILGLEYHWGTKSYKWDKPPMPMPSLVTSISQSIVSSIPWSTVFGSEQFVDHSTWSTSYRPEAGVVNFYQFKDTLTAHVDQSEVDATKPLISISLGESAIFLVGGESREDRPIPLLLKSGDVVVMSGKSRRVFHGVPRVIEGKMAQGLLEEEGWNEWKNGQKMREFVKGTRININVRHVYADD